jgi:hypothetical protein
MDRMVLNKTNRFQALLELGYFPKELPPPFNTKSLAKYRKSIDNAWNNGNDYPKSKPEIFSTPRINNWRRDLSIVNPIAQFYLSSLIASEWPKIRKHINGDSFSAQHLEISSDKLRSVEEPDFRLIAMLKSEISGQFDYALVSDISRFYGTLYTHAIPWALHGKAYCKSILDTPAYKQLLGTKLDVAVRKGNENQTAGIPIGPDTSRILSEIVISQVDASFAKISKIKRSGAVRNVDDWFIGFDSIGEAEKNIALLSAECRVFQLEIHPEKTRPIDLTKLISELWTDQLTSIDVPKGTKNQQRQIEHFFELAFKLSVENPNSNVLKFALSIARSWTVDKSNWHIFENFLLRAVRANKTVLPQFVQLIANYRDRKFDITIHKMDKLIDDILRSHVPTGGHFEVCWALFLIKALGSKISAERLEDVCKLESSVCALIVLDLRDKGQVEGQLDDTIWLQSMTPAGLSSGMWLLAYEADLKGWISIPGPNHVDNNFYFNELKKRNISFYNDKKNVKLLSKEKPRKRSPELMELMAKLRGISLEELSNLDVTQIPPTRFYYSTYGE